MAYWTTDDYLQNHIIYYFSAILCCHWHTLIVLKALNRQFAQDCSCVKWSFHIFFCCRKKKQKKFRKRFLYFLSIRFFVVSLFSSPCGVRDYTLWSWPFYLEAGWVHFTSNSFSLLIFSLLNNCGPTRFAQKEKRKTRWRLPHPHKHTQTRINTRLSAKRWNSEQLYSRRFPVWIVASVFCLPS